MFAFVFIEMNVVKYINDLVLLVKIIKLSEQ